MASIKSIIGRLLRPTRIDPPQADDSLADPRCSECGTIGSTRTPLLKIAAKKWARRGRILIFALFALWLVDSAGPIGQGWSTGGFGADIGSLNSVRHICPEPVSDDGALALVSHIQASDFRPRTKHVLDRFDLAVYISAKKPLFKHYYNDLYTRWGWPVSWVVHERYKYLNHDPFQGQFQVRLDQIDIIDRARREYVRVNLMSISIAFCLLVALAWCTSAAQRRLRLLLLTLGVVSLLCLTARTIETEDYPYRYQNTIPAFKDLPTGLTAADVLSNDRQSRINAGRRIASVIHRSEIPQFTVISVNAPTQIYHRAWGTGYGHHSLGWLLKISVEIHQEPRPTAAALDVGEYGTLTFTSAHSGEPSDSRLRIDLYIPALAWYIAVIVIAGWIIRIAIWKIGKRVRPDWAQPRFACRTCGYDLSNTPPAPATDT